MDVLKCSHKFKSDPWRQIKKVHNAVSVQMLTSYPNRAKSILSIFLLPPFYLAVNYIFSEILQKWHPLKVSIFKNFRILVPDVGVCLYASKLHPSNMFWHTSGSQYAKQDFLICFNISLHFHPLHLKQSLSKCKRIQFHYISVHPTLSWARRRHREPSLS